MLSPAAPADVEILDAVLDRIGGLQEFAQNKLSTALNDRLYVLTIVSAIMMPLSFVTGLLGVQALRQHPGARHALGLRRTVRGCSSCSLWASTCCCVACIGSHARRRAASALVQGQSVRYAKRSPSSGQTTVRGHNILRGC